MKPEAIKLLRQLAVYFVQGKWPDVIQAQIPELDPKKTYLFAIVEVDQ